MPEVGHMVKATCVTDYFPHYPTLEAGICGKGTCDVISSVCMVCLLPLSQQHGTAPMSRKDSQTAKKRRAITVLNMELGDNFKH